LIQNHLDLDISSLGYYTRLQQTNANTLASYF